MFLNIAFLLFVSYSLVLSAHGTSTVKCVYILSLVSKQMGMEPTNLPTILIELVKLQSELASLVGSDSLSKLCFADVHFGSKLLFWLTMID